MSKIIRMPERIYNRLETYAIGFDTPAQVIERILNAFENAGLEVDINDLIESEGMEPSEKVDVVYLAGDENIFKQQLLDRKKAYVKLFYTNDWSEIREWDASSFKITSSVNANLRSGYLRDWKTKGIIKAIVTVDKKGFGE